MKTVETHDDDIYDSGTGKLVELTPPASQVPEDKNNVVYYSFIYLGCCILLPWSAVLNVMDFFFQKVTIESPFD
jgi:hypothetical protein